MLDVVTIATAKSTGCFPDKDMALDLQRAVIRSGANVDEIRAGSVFVSMRTIGIFFFSNLWNKIEVVLKSAAVCGMYLSRVLYCSRFLSFSSVASLPLICS